MFKVLVTALAFLVSCGAFGSEIDKLIAEGKWGNSFASYQVARAYDTGKGVNVDKTKAVNWYQKSAKQNNSTAQIALGLKYVIGKDIPQNKEMAYVWFRAAEENGHKMGNAYRLKIEKELSKQQIESAEKQYLSLEKELPKR